MRGTKDLYIGSCYRPPDKHDKEYLEHLQSYLSRIPTHNGAHLWLGGDFNLADIDWKEESVKPYPVHGAQCHQFLSIVKDNFLDQVVTEPTRITETSSTTLDLFFTNNTTLVNQVHVIPGISDHEAVFIESSLRPMKNTPAPRKIFQYRKADYEGFKRELNDFTPDFLYRKRNKLFKKQKSSNRPKDISNYKQMRARVQKAERQAYWRHIENLIEIGDPEKDQNPGKQKRFWSYIKSLRKDN